MVVKTFWEICNNTDECSDHRYVCMPDEENVYRCICDRFHKWMGRQFGCMQSVNVSEILQTVSNAYNFEEFIERESKLLYRLNAAAGILVIVIFSIAALLVIYYGYHIEKQDRELEESLLGDGGRKNRDQCKLNKYETIRIV